MSFRISSRYVNKFKNLKNFENDCEKVKYFEDILKGDDEFVSQMRETEINALKNLQKSEDVRLMGNQFYKQLKYIDALKCYNESICYAPADSINIALAYLNRSALMFQLRHYEQCLKNIEMAKAIKATLPDDLTLRLKTRENRCLFEIKNRGYQLDQVDVRNVENEFTLSYDPDPDIPYIVNCLEIRDSKTGRGVFTGRALKPGDIIAIEECYAASPKFEIAYSNCHNCLKENYFCLFPCENCTSTMYCTTECQKADELFHQIECPIRNIFTQFFDDDDKLVLPLKMTLQTLIKYDYDFDKCYQNYKTFTITNDFKEIIEKKYLTEEQCIGINNLLRIDSTNKRFNPFYLFTAILNYFVREKTSFGCKYIKANEKLENIFCELLFDNFLVVAKNSFAYPDYYSYFLSFSSYFNHSCLPNCFVWRKNMKEYLFINKNIKENEEIFISYGPLADVQSTEHRQKQLQNANSFECTCYACINYLEPSGVRIFKPNAEISSICTNPKVKLNHHTFRKRFKDCCKYIEKYSNNIFREDVVYVKSEMAKCIENLFWETSITEKSIGMDPLYTS